MTRAWLVLLALPGCIVVDLDEPPWIRWAEATCGYDPGLRAWTWTFEADVFDRDGDVRFVDAHVYDEIAGVWADSFPLDPEVGSTLWYSAWTERSTYLYCGDPYAIDFVAEDARLNTDVYTVYIGDWWR